MMTDLNDLICRFRYLTLDKTKIIKIQSLIRGCLVRMKILPIFLYQIRSYLVSQSIILSKKSKDGRVNSSLDEDQVINILIEKFPDRIKKVSIRMWYDILVLDNRYGWIPVNIKTTTTKSSDNTGNFAMCVYAYTDEKLDIHRNKTYSNQDMSNTLYLKLKNKEYNHNFKKDYYFLVINKQDSKDIIVNSIKGLRYIKPNINNLPFQICWNKNRKFRYQHIQKCIDIFVECFKQTKPNWKDRFMANMNCLFGDDQS